MASVAPENFGDGKRPLAGFPSPKFSVATMPRRTIEVTRRGAAKRSARHSALQTDVPLHEPSWRYGGLTAIGRRGAAAFAILPRAAYRRLGSRHVLRHPPHPLPRNVPRPARPIARRRRPRA